MEIVVTVPLLRNNLGEIFYGPRTESESLTPPTRVNDVFDVRFSTTAFGKLQNKIRRSDYEDWLWHKLARNGLLISSLQNFSELLCPKHLAELWRRQGVIPYPHQLETLRKVVTEMRGRAILADEVGLGKTIEAGMILKEYMLRGLVRKVLILTPASLCWQWFEELRDKFGIIARIQRHEFDWTHSDVLIASIDVAKRSPHREIILEIDYDMLIVDEAHRLKNSRTANWQLVNQISKKFFLLLTATPVQNDLKELYNLITLLKPGQLGSYQAFKKQYMLDKRTPNNSDQLKRLLGQVMIRNRRGEGTVQFTKRIVQAVPIQPTPEELSFYKAVTQFVKEEYVKSLAEKRNTFALITLQREACSSPWAAAVTLQKFLENCRDPKTATRLQELIEQAMAMNTSSKLEKLVELVKNTKEKVLVFTEYRASMEYIRKRLEEAGFATLGFDGSLSPGRKEWQKFLFQKYGDVLVSTESGGEGLNFQFCHHVINFDLPWNPMRIEQRIGRVHRLGQTRDVYIYNFSTTGTIEEYIVYLLQEKISMFEMVIGELDAILNRLEDDKSFESRIMDILAASDDDDELLRQINRLGETILQARKELTPNILDSILK